MGLFQVGQGPPHHRLSTGLLREDMIWGQSCPHRDLLLSGRAPTPAEGDTGARQAASPRGHLGAEPQRGGGGVRDARSGAESHIWARSRLLEAGPRQAADNPPDSGSQGACAAPIGSCQRGLPIYPPPRRGAASGTGGRMVPARALGLLLCVQLCGGECWGWPWGRGWPWASSGQAVGQGAGSSRGAGAPRAQQGPWG